jgi:hypothetical protein
MLLCLCFPASIFSYLFRKARAVCVRVCTSSQSLSPAPVTSAPTLTDRNKGREGVGYRLSGVRRVDIPWEHLSSLYGGDSGGVHGLPPDRSASPPHLRDRFPARTAFFMDTRSHHLREPSHAIEEILRGDAGYGDPAHAMGLHPASAGVGSTTPTELGSGLGDVAYDGAVKQPVPPSSRPASTASTARRVVSGSSLHFWAGLFGLRDLGLCEGMGGASVEVVFCPVFCSSSLAFEAQRSPAVQWMPPQHPYPHCRLPREVAWRIVLQRCQYSTATTCTTQATRTTTPVFLPSLPPPSQPAEHPCQCDQCA